MAWRVRIVLGGVSPLQGRGASSTHLLGPWSPLYRDAILHGQTACGTCPAHTCVDVRTAALLSQSDAWRSGSWQRPRRGLDSSAEDPMTHTASLRPQLGQTACSVLDALTLHSIVHATAASELRAGHRSSSEYCLYRTGSRACATLNHTDACRPSSQQCHDPRPAPSTSGAWLFRLPATDWRGRRCCS
jgi:hypothetical protein